MRTGSTLVLGVWMVTLGGGPAQAAAPPPPYSLPWLLRPAAVGKVARFDSTLGFDSTLARFEDPSTREGGTTFVESLTASYKISKTLAPLVRLSFIRNNPPGGGASGGATSNPLLGLNWVRPWRDDWRLSLFAASTIPIGSGGGDEPAAAAQAAVAAAIPARSAMDNALFAVNYWTLVGGAGLTRVSPGLTLQAEVTVLQLTRVRGPESQDSSRTNLTAGLHAGRFLNPKVSVGAELRVQRWMTNAAPVRADPAARETVSFGVGPRLHLKIAGRMVRPGLSWSRPLDAPLTRRNYNMFALDVPVAF